MTPDSDAPQLADIIARRFSTRAFSTAPVDTVLIESVLEAARWAPSYGNRQSTRFVVAREPGVLAQIHEALTRGNAYAKRAPVLIAVCGAPEWGQIVAGREYYLMDAGLAVENLLLQAVQIGLAGHPMGGFDEATVRDVLGVPEHVRVLALVALGYPGDIAELDERTRERELRPRTRLEPEALHAWDGWAWADTDEATDQS